MSAFKLSSQFCEVCMAHRVFFLALPACAASTKDWDQLARASIHETKQAGRPRAYCNPHHQFTGLSGSHSPSERRPMQKTVRRELLSKHNPPNRSVASSFNQAQHAKISRKSVKPNSFHFEDHPASWNRLGRQRTRLLGCIPLWENYDRQFQTEQNRHR